MYGESTDEAGVADVDYCTGGGQEIGCEGTTPAVATRATGRVSVGETDAGSGSTEVYLVGSGGADEVTAHYAGTAVEFSLGGAGARFDTSREDAAGCTVTASQASCPLGTPVAPNVPALDALTIAGMGGNDVIAAVDFPDGTGLTELGGAGSDTLTGGGGGDVLVDGPPPAEDGTAADTSADFLHGEAGDDALLHSGGADLLDGGPGSDLFLSVEVCEGATIAGGASVGGDRDNSSWARLGGGGVAADLLTGQVGRVGAGETVACPGGVPDRMEGIEDLEGSEGDDLLIGDEGANQLLGHRGEDTYRALGGDDSLFANSGTRDRVIDCGDGNDAAVIDLAAVGDPAPIGCERVREGAANEYQLAIEQPAPAPVTAPPVVTPPPAPPPPRDRTPPRTELSHRPARVIRVAPGRRAAVAFRFGASESSHFECKLDRKPWRRCRSPLHTHLAPGRHVFRVFAIDAAGNRDKTPALARVRVVAQRHRGHHHRLR
jgi:Ca2+-binding RTX toxin-like protein